MYGGTCPRIASATDYEPMEDRNLNAIFATLSTSSLYNKRVQTFIDSKVTSASTESSSMQPSDMPHLLYNSFLMLLSNISNPFVNRILAFLTILALAWGFILTIISCGYAFLFGKRRYLRTIHHRFPNWAPPDFARGAAKVVAFVNVKSALYLEIL